MGKLLSEDVSTSIVTVLTETSGRPLEEWLAEEITDPDQLIQDLMDLLRSATLATMADPETRNLGAYGAAVIALTYTFFAGVRAERNRVGR